MQELFNDFLELEDVKSIIFVSREGKLLYKKIVGYDHDKFNETSWIRPIWSLLNTSDELEFVFENGRLYVRKTAGGVLLFFLGSFAQFAMVRMKCDIAIPKIEKSFNGKKISRFFRRS